MPGIFPSCILRTSFIPASIAMEKTSFVLLFYGFLLETTATHGIAVSKIVTYNDGLIPAFAHTPPPGLSSFVVFFAVNY